MEGTPVFRLILIAALVATSARPVFAGQVFWDNNIFPDGSGFRGISEPEFPSVRVADDFVASSLRLSGAHVAVVEDDGWSRGPLLQVFIYEDAGGEPGAIAVEYTGGYSFEDQGERLFDRDVFHYWIAFPDEDIFLDPDETYWFGFRTLGGSGSGSNYWLISDGGPNGRDSSTGFFSTDGGNTWRNEGDDWHYAFELTDVIPAPGALGLLALTGLMTAHRRRRV